MYSHKWMAHVAQISQAHPRYHNDFPSQGQDPFQRVGRETRGVRNITSSEKDGVEVFFSSKSLTHQNVLRNDQSHQHMTDLMGVCKQPQFLRVPRSHFKVPSNPCTLMTEELKGEIIRGRKNPSDPICGAFRSYSKVMSAFHWKVETHNTWVPE